MPHKEDRSDWVAVAPEFSEAGAKSIRKASSAYHFFQKDVAEQIKRQMEGNFDIAVYGRKVQERWQQLSDSDRDHYNNLARQDAARFAQESHQADVEAMRRREQLQKERETLLLDTEGGDQRTTRRQLHNKHRRDPNDEANDSDDEDDRPRPSKKPLSHKQIMRQEQLKQQKADQEAYIQNRQQDLRKERATQAKRRLEFLLKQSNIFAHFGRVKEDTAKYGIKSGSRRDAHEEDDTEQAMEEADEHEATFLTTQPTTLGFGKMREYQLEGLNWMIRLQENGVNGILADEMGLGKTLQSISILVYMQEYQNVDGPHLILVPKSTLSNWMNELARWAPTLKAVKFHGDKTARQELIQNLVEPAQRDENRTWNVLVTTYEICNIEKNTLGKFAWSYMIIDEAHRLKNEASAFSKTVRTFETRYRLLLTGTPLQNSLHELWALLNFLVPDVFENAEQFDEWFNLDIDDNDEKNKLILQLHKILRPFMLRRLKADVEKSLPPKHETILFTGMSAMQKKLYRDILTRDIEAIQGKSGSRTAILNIVMQLRKCAGHPYLFPGVEDRSLPPLGEHLVENCGKMVLLDKLLTRLKERGHRVLLFTQMTRILDIMEDYLVMRHFSYCRIDGNTSYEDREGYIDTFNAPDSDKFLFLLSTRAGGLGINLQTADVVILYDSDWNPQADLQAQDRAHRIGQKKPVQVFRLVTEHTVEEKIVERAQQKLKLDAMVVQQGRLKDKDKLSKEELLQAIRFGADKIFKSKDSSITNDDIDFIMDQGKKKTQELNEKLQTADKGDLLDFKLDGSSVQTFEGVDYSQSALMQAKAQAEMLGIFDIGKRERKEANYNENTLFQRQISAQQGPPRPKKKKEIRLPKHLRLPRMEEWMMYDREKLNAIQAEEEAAFKALPEDIQKKATAKQKGLDTTEDDENGDADEPFVLPDLIPEERMLEKTSLLSEGFSSWNRFHYQAFWRGSARYGRDQLDKVALEVGKSEESVRTFASAFWGEWGKTRISEHEYDRAVKFIERGEKKILEIAGLERATETLVSLFDNPWEELEFTFHNCKDKMFTTEEDRYLLCWAYKYGYGQWYAIRYALRRHGNFRFDYFLRSLPVEQLGRRCEQLMKAAEKEVELIEKNLREMAGLPTEPLAEGVALPAIQIPKYRELQKQLRERDRQKAVDGRRELEAKVEELNSEIERLQTKLKGLNNGARGTSNVSGARSRDVAPVRMVSEPKIERVAQKEPDPAPSQSTETDGAAGPGGEYMAFPAFEGSEPPTEWKKPFTHFCNHTRKKLKADMDPAERKNKAIVNERLKDRWLSLSDDDKLPWREWSEWDRLRFARDQAIYESRLASSGEGRVSEDFEDDAVLAVHVPKKTKRKSEAMGSVPKKRKT